MGWLVLIVGAVVAIVALRADVVRRYSMSVTATLDGIDNTPTDPDIIARLQFLATQDPLVAAILHEVEPLAVVTSGYRCPELNAAVGGVPTSRHQYGLALDYGGCLDNTTAVEHMKNNAERLPPQLRMVIAEGDHVHCDWFDPLGKLDSGSGTCQFIQKTGANDFAPI